MEVDAVVNGKGQPKEKGKSKGKGKSDNGKGQPKGKGSSNGKVKRKSPSRRIRNPTASVSFVAKLDILPKIVITEFVL